MNNEFKQIALSRLQKAPYNVRDIPEESEIEPMVNTMRRQDIGVIQPLLVREIDHTEDSDARKYEIIGGGIRYEAARRAGLPTVPCMVMSVSPTQAELISILENIQRFNYKPIERARVIEKIVERFDGNKMEAAKALGFKTTSVITDWLAPLEVDPEAMRIIKPVAGQTTTKRVTLLASLPKANQKVAAEILNEKASNDIEARRIVTAIKQHPSEEPKAVVERLQTMPQPISVLVQVTPNVNEALEQACVASKLTKAKLVEVALEEYLTAKGYLNSKQR